MHFHVTFATIKLKILSRVCRLLIRPFQEGKDTRTISIWSKSSFSPLELEEAQERTDETMSNCSHVTKKAWVIAGIVAACMLVYFLTTAPLLPIHQLPYITPDVQFCDHPVARLVYDAQRSFNATRDAQSQSLDEAVTEYRRRYRMPPPPNFDKWYDFATARNTVMVDEFDNIYHAMLPFWGISPSDSRARSRRFGPPKCPDGGNDPSGSANPQEWRPRQFSGTGDHSIPAQVCRVVT